MQDGTIVELIERASGFGFIRVIGTKEPLFFHSDDLTNVQFRELKKGDKLHFTIKKTIKGPYAMNVSRLTA